MHYPKLSAFLCGFVSVTALPPLHILPVLFIGISILLILIWKSDTPKQAFLRGYCFGFSFFSFGLSWIGNAVLIDQTYLMFLYPIIFISCGAFFALFIAVPAWLSRYLKKPLCTYLSFCALIVIFEWIRSFILTGFPWNLWGTVFAFSTSFIQLSAFGGTYLLSLLALLIFGAPFFWIISPSKTRFISTFGISFLSLFIIFYAGQIRLDKESNEKSTTIIRFVQPSIPQTLKWNPTSLEQNFDTHINLSKQDIPKEISAILWGETASPFPLDFDEEHNQKIRQAIPEKGYLITGMVRYYTHKGYPKAANSLMAFDSHGNPVAYYDKSHLVPFGEYIPLRRWLPNWLRPLANTIGTFTPGPGPQKIELQNLPSFGVAICYEAIFPHKILDQANRPEWIINPTNDGWYGDSFGPHQHFTATRLRAVEEGITIARIANNGISALISPYGTIIGKLNLNQAGFIDLSLPVKTSLSTTYSRYGNAIILNICIFLLALALLFHFKP